jgi:hypothetical protein
MSFRLAGAVVLALLASSCTDYGGGGPASQLASSKRECFPLAAVSGYNYVGDRKINVSTGPNETYQFTTMGPCPSLGYGEAIAFDTTTPTPICSGIDVTLIVPSDIGPQRCPVEMIRKLPPKQRG